MVRVFPSRCRLRIRRGALLRQCANGPGHTALTAIIRNRCDQVRHRRTRRPRATVRLRGLVRSRSRLPRNVVDRGLPHRRGSPQRPDAHHRAHGRIPPRHRRHRPPRGRAFLHWRTRHAHRRQRPAGLPVSRLPLPVSDPQSLRLAGPRRRLQHRAHRYRQGPQRPPLRLLRAGRRRQLQHQARELHQQHRPDVPRRLMGPVSRHARCEPPADFRRRRPVESRARLPPQLGKLGRRHPRGGPPCAHVSPGKKHHAPRRR